MPFVEYGIAMERKLEIAKFHARCLGRLLPADPEDRDMPPIPLQAHFEAAGRAVASIPDQLASGIVVSIGDAVPCLPRENAAYLQKVVEKLPKSDIREVLQGFVDDPRYCDLRSWRNRATHRFDRKRSRGGQWFVEPPDGCKEAIKPRDVANYTQALIDFGAGIVQQIGTIEELAVALRDRYTE